jgi:hypothetical protein
MASTLPKKSTRRLDRVGPRPGVKVSASQYNSLLSFAIEVFSDDARTEVAISGQTPPRATLCFAEKPSQGYASHE